MYMYYFVFLSPVSDVCFIVFKYFDKVAAHIFAILAETKHDKQVCTCSFHRNLTKKKKKCG